MRDDRSRWPAALGNNRANLVSKNVEAGLVRIARQTVISGEISACLRACTQGSAVEGGPAIAHGSEYALRQRRDRILVVNGPELADGWNEEHAVAVSDMTAAYHVVSLSGEYAEKVIATGTEFSNDGASASVSRLWHGYGVLVYRHEHMRTFRVHVRSAQLDAVWEMIERQIDLLSNLA